MHKLILYWLQPIAAQWIPNANYILIYCALEYRENGVRCVCMVDVSTWSIPTLLCPWIWLLFRSMWPFHQKSYTHKIGWMKMIQNNRYALGRCKSGENMSKLFRFGITGILSHYMEISADNLDTQKFNTPPVVGGEKWIQAMWNRIFALSTIQSISPCVPRNFIILCTRLEMVA